MSVQQTIALLCCLGAVSSVASVAIDPPLSKPAAKELAQAPGTSIWATNKMAIITVAVLVAGAGLAAIVIFFMPMVAYRICYTLGGCQNTMENYVDRLVGNELTTARNVRARSKRTVEYIEPLLVTLAQAYERYSDDGEKKNFKTPSYYTE